MIKRRLIPSRGAFQSPLWTCPACTRAAAIRPPFLQQRRGYQVPRLGYDEEFKQNGIPGLLSPQGYALAWIQYQNIMVQKLNELTAGQPSEGQEPKALAMQFARDPMQAALFNHASMAFNNHFFFRTLSTAPLGLGKVAELRKSLVDAFGSVETLRSTFVETAAAMFGPGFVWLVWTRDSAQAAPKRIGAPHGTWKILATYLAGTPYPEAGYRQQGLDMNTNNAASYEAYQSQLPANRAGAFGPLSSGGREQAKLPPGAASVIPVLCVNTWEHVWIYDYGLAGKRKFLTDWWNAVDWGAVDNNTPTAAKPSAKLAMDFARS